MTVDLHPDTVERARERAGGPDDDRPDSIDDVLDRAELGHGEGDPLVEGCESYRDYPDTPEELSNPKWVTFLRELFAHSRVNGYDGAVTELTGANDSGIVGRWRDALERAARTFDLDVPTLFDKGAEERENDREGRLTTILGYEPPADVVDAENPLVVAELYLAGLSVAEVCDVLADYTEGVREGQVRDALRTVGFIHGPTRDEQRDTFEENEGRLGGISMDFSDVEERNPGVNINSEKVESDPNISVE